MMTTDLLHRTSIKCTNCGANVQKVAKFCNACGTAVVSARVSAGRSQHFDTTMVVNNRCGMGHIFYSIFATSAMLFLIWIYFLPHMDEHSKPSLLVVIAIFAGCAALGLSKVFKRGPRYSLDADGITFCGSRVGTIPWNEIEYAELKKVISSSQSPFSAQYNYFVVLQLGEFEQKYVDQLSSFERILRYFYRKDCGPIFLAMSDTDANAADICELINEAIRTNW